MKKLEELALDKKRNPKHPSYGKYRAVKLLGMSDTVKSSGVFIAVGPTGPKGFMLVCKLDETVLIPDGIIEMIEEDFVETVYETGDSDALGNAARIEKKLPMYSVKRVTLPAIPELKEEKKKEKKKKSKKNKEE